jgi:hypothetical protein
MSEATSSPNFNANLIPTALQLNDALRHGAADLAHLLQYLVSSASVPGAGLVMGGLNVVGKANDMRVDVLAGYGAVYNGAVTPPEHPLEAVVLREDDVSPLLNDGDGSDPRIDVISIDPSSSLFDSEPLLIPDGGGATQAAFTRRGPGYVIKVTEGVPDPSPSAPGTPTGALKLAEVLVPAGLTAAGGGTSAATITDFRNRASLETKGPDSSREGWWQLVSTWGSVVDMLTLVGIQEADGKALQLVGDLDEHWPAFFRSDVPTGDQAGYAYPMLIPFGRSHPLSVPFNAGDPSNADASVNVQGFGALQFGGVRIEHLTANIAARRASAVFPTPSRGASLSAYKVRYEVFTAEPSSLDARAVVYDASAGAVVNLSGLTPLAKTVGVHEVSLNAPVEFVPDEGDIVGIRADADFAAAADSSAVELRLGTATVTEGRA